jgi:hypothetical protein
MPFNSLAPKVHCQWREVMECQVRRGVAALSIASVSVPFEHPLRKDDACAKREEYFSGWPQG